MASVSDSGAPPAKRSAVLTPDLAGLPRPRRDGLDGFITDLINALGERPDPVVLVLDDLHEAASPGVVADLEVLAEHGPPSLRLVLSTRVDPTLRLQRLRLAGRLGEVRAADLALTTAEARSVCEEAGVDLDDGHLDLLVERTGGWPVGVKLAALSLQGRPDPGCLRGQLRRRRPGRERLPRHRGAVAPAGGAARLLVAHRARSTGSAESSPMRSTGGSAGRAMLAELASHHGLATPLDTPRRVVLVFAAAARGASPGVGVPDPRAAAAGPPAGGALVRGPGTRPRRASPRGRGRGLGPCGRPGRAALAAAGRARPGLRSARVPRTHPGAGRRCRRRARSRRGWVAFRGRERGCRRRPPGHRIRADRFAARGETHAVRAPPRRPRLCIARACGGTWTPR